MLTAFLIILSSSLKSVVWGNHTLKTIVLQDVLSRLEDQESLVLGKLAQRQRLHLEEVLAQ